MASFSSDNLVHMSSTENNQQELPFLSIIIPAYNEETRLPQALDQILAWQKGVAFDVEVLVVENGSVDQTTAVAENYAKKYANIRVLHSQKGKGSAVQMGMLSGSGQYLFICDADLSMPIAEVEKFLRPELTAFDIVIGSREAPGAVRYNEPYYRHLMGRVFNWLVWLLAVRGFHDTQCGFKLFNQNAARAIFCRQQITGWTFDVEALYLARKEGYTISEVPIHWYYNADSKVRPLHDTWIMFWDVVKIRFNFWLGRYNIHQMSAISKFAK